MGLPEGVPDLGLEHVSSGKVRETFRLDDERLVLVATDRISAFDFVLDQAIPNKGRALTAMTDFWVEELEGVATHVDEVGEYDLPEEADHPYYAGRLTVVRTAEIIPVECIVRGRLTGSGLKDYNQTGTIKGLPLPEGLLETDALDPPIFTPSTKAEQGMHDENISFERMIEIVGEDTAEQARAMSIDLFTRAAAHAAERGIVIADTKFEFGYVDGELVLCDEVLTPDSSRFWPADEIVRGELPPSFDKEYVRQYLKENGWNKEQPPAGCLTDEVIANTAAKYKEAHDRITGRDLADWPGYEPVAA